MDVLVQVKDWWQKKVDEFRPFLEEKEIVPEKEPGLEEEIERARQQWQNARNYFQNVSEPELVDHASYRLRAAETRYMYLLNKARENEQKLEQKNENREDRYGRRYT
ncbi:MAG: DUF2508 family protein [Halanaerobiaceae bacterium]